MIATLGAWTAAPAVSLLSPKGASALVELSCSPRKDYHRKPSIHAAASSAAYLILTQAYVIIKGMKIILVVTAKRHLE